MKGNLNLILAILLLLGLPSCSGSSKEDTAKGEQAKTETPTSYTPDSGKGTMPRNQGLYVFDPKGNKMTLAGFGVYGDKVAVGGAGGPEAVILSVGKTDFISKINDVSSLNWEDATPYINGGGYVMKVTYKGETYYYRFILSDSGDEIAYQYELFQPDKK